MSELMSISNLKREPPFSTLFTINPSTKEGIISNMRDFGFDESKPIDVWRQTMIVVDGNTRIEAAIAAGIDEVYIFYHDFENKVEALEYAIHNQRNRRNITDSELLRCIEALDETKPRGRPKLTEDFDGNTKKASIEAFKAGNENVSSEIEHHHVPVYRQLIDSRKSAEDTANVIGSSRAKVERARKVLRDPIKKEEVLSGEKTIHKAYTEIKEEEKVISKGTSKFNETNDNIEWAKWSWNPVTGCKMGCPYCYARDIANRFQGGFDPAFHPERLTMPENTQVPPKADTDIGFKNVFVCSMADLFGDWVPQEWIDRVIEAVRKNPQWNFLFLTKNPSRLVGIDWPKNAWVGTTVDVQARVAPAKMAFRQISAPIKFLSCEPLREELDFGDMSMFDWIIIGGQSKSTQEPAKQPDWSWVESLITEARRSELKVYFKPNLETRPKEYPQ